MLKFQWNALRLGHHVTVHDPATPGADLAQGTVVMIETAPARRGANGVGIRVTDDTGETTVRWPSYLTVHLDPDDGTEPCWRCDEIAARQSELRRCGRCRELFPGDPTLPAGLDHGWWACPPCRERIIGAGALARPTWPAKGATTGR